MHELTLLLVDDHEAFLNAAQRQLRTLDWLRIVGRALNGREAVLRTEELRPQVVVMDLAMPEMGGLQATRLIKAQDDPPYVIIASHFDDAEHREHAARAGADAFIGKSDYARDLLPLLERLAGAEGA
jgi:DNA-binding NarL/FixJ family response regulator